MSRKRCAHCGHNPDRVVDVIFRTWKDGSGVIALFPTIPHNDRYITSYEHVGQHGPADYQSVLNQTRPATQADYAPLQRELASIGYALQVRSRRRS